jgi:hypothetical protein
MACKIRRRVTRETSDTDASFHRTLMVQLEEGGRFLRIWQKGRRTKLTATYQEIFRWAYQRDAKKAIADRKAAKRAKKNLTSC